ncbi:MAG: hypothetical protein ACRDZ7_12795 [Acidimicrobiia bacterium]
MRRPPIVLLAGGLLALALAPPVFGAGESTTPPPGGGYATTSSTAPSDDETTPPDDGTSTPPDDGTSTPPDDGTSTPPDDGTSTPPDDGTSTPPEDDTSSANCSTPETLQEPAPAEGESVIYPAGDAGDVEVSRRSPTELEVVDAAASDGWTAEVTTPTGPRVKVRFVDDANTSSKTRFAASMDQKGEEIHIRVTNCS